MKTTRETEDQLILANTPWVLAIALTMFILCFVGAGILRMSENVQEGLFMALAGAIGGAIFLLAFVRRTQLILDRGTGTVTLRRRSFFGYSEKTFALEALSRALTEESRSRNGAGTRRAALVFDRGPDKGTHPITIVYTSGKGPERAVDAINRWIEHGQPPNAS